MSIVYLSSKYLINTNLDSNWKQYIEIENNLETAWFDLFLLFVLYVALNRAIKLATAVASWYSLQ